MDTISSKTAHCFSFHSVSPTSQESLKNASLESTRTQSFHCPKTQFTKASNRINATDNTHSSRNLQSNYHMSKRIQDFLVLMNLLIINVIAGPCKWFAGAQGKPVKGDDKNGFESRCDFL